MSGWKCLSPDVVQPLAVIAKIPFDYPPTKIDQMAEGG
jgi:hypothetical protein